jgi:hypothetical protein
MAGAINIPGHAIRTRAGELDKSVSYIICSDNVGKSVLGAFHFLERGLDAVYREVPMQPYITPVRPAPAPPPAQPGAGAMNDRSQDKERSAGAGNGNGRAGPAPARPVTNAARDDSRVPREQFADTITGQELADIIDELYHQRKEIESSDRFQLSAPGPGLGGSPIEGAGQTAAAEPELGVPESLVKDIVREIDHKLTHYIKQAMAARQDELVKKLKEHAAQIEKVAQEKVKAHEVQMRAHFEDLYSERELKLRSDYERLTGLANKLAQQKAEIQLTRRRLAEMLQTANRVHQAVYQAGATLVSQVDHLGQIEDEGGKH